MSDPGSNVVAFPSGAPSGPGPAAPMSLAAALSGPVRSPNAAPQMPTPGPAMPPPGMVLNPAYQTWLVISQLWQAEHQRRQTQFLAACHLIRHDVPNSYKIDIEADSTVAADEEMEKRSRTEFLQALLPMLQLLIPQAQQMPGAIPLIHDLVMFGVRGFPAARSLEESFEESFRTLASTPPTPPPPKGNVKPPEELAIEARTAAGEQQVDHEANQIKASEIASKTQVDQQKNAVEMFKAYMQMAGTRQQQQQDAAFKGAELAQQQQEKLEQAALVRARLTGLLARETPGLV